MTPAQQARYRAAWDKLMDELNALEEMINDYPEPGAAIDPALAFEVEDLGRKLNALTVLWINPTT